MDSIQTIILEQQRLDFSEVIHLEKKLNDAIKNHIKVILVDLASVEYVDSRSIGLFVAFKIRCESQNIFLGFYNICEDVRYIFKVTCVDTVIDMFPSKEEAESKAFEFLKEEDEA